MTKHSAPSQTQPPQSAVQRLIGSRFWLAAGRVLAASGKGTLVTVRAAGALIDGLKPFAWPAVVLFVFLRYEGPLLDLVDRISEADTPFGKITFDPSGVRDTDDDLSELVGAVVLSQRCFRLRRCGARCRLNTVNPPISRRRRGRQGGWVTAEVAPHHRNGDDRNCPCAGSLLSLLVPKIQKPAPQAGQPTSQAYA